jgi:hypothetical protein
MRVERILVLSLLFMLSRCGEEALEVHVSHPDDGSTVNGILRITVDASDNVVGVSFYVDDSCMYYAQAVPFIYVWNTFLLPDSSQHVIYAIAENRKGDEVCSDSVWVIVANGITVFADDFESYMPRTYPDAGWFEIWPGAGSNQTYVDSGVANCGIQGFRLCGLSVWPRTDGVELELADIQQLTYSASIMIPSVERTGALFGFFLLLNPQLGTIYNGVWFSQEDSLIYARGIAEDSTGCVWKSDTWYSVDVSIDFVSLMMNVWVDSEQIVFDLPACPCNWTDTFALATEYGSAGLVYYDDIKIFKGTSKH